MATRPGVFLVLGETQKFCINVIIVTKEFRAYEHLKSILISSTSALATSKKTTRVDLAIIVTRATCTSIGGSWK